MKKMLDYEAATVRDKGIPCNIFQNTNPIVIVLFISLLFELLYQRGYQRKYFWRLNFKKSSYEAATY